MKHGEEEEVKLAVTLFVNRASAMHKMDLPEECLRDCNRAIVLSPDYAKYCQELAGGKPFQRNMDVDKMWSEFSADIEKHVRDTIADSYSKYAVTNLNTEHIPEHMHECGGANWSAVLSPHVVLAGRVMMQSIEKRKASGEFSKPMEPLDHAHNYLEIPSEVKLQLHIFASVLSYRLQCYASDFPVTGDSVLKLVILMPQIKINSMPVVHMESSGGYTTFKESQRLLVSHDAFSCTVEQILEMLYHPNHIVIGHELMKFASIQLALGDGTAALYIIKRLEAIFALYYGSHAANLFPYIEDIRREAENLAC